MTGLSSRSQQSHRKNNPSIVAQDMSKKVAKLRNKMAVCKDSYKRIQIKTDKLLFWK